MPSLYSLGTRPDLHTCMNRVWRARLTGPRTHLRSSRRIPSGPDAQPFLNFLMAQTTSSSVFSSTLASSEGAADADSESSEVSTVPCGLFNAVMKYSAQHAKTSSSELHRESLALWIKVHGDDLCWCPARVLIALKADRVRLWRRSSSTS